MVAGAGIEHKKPPSVTTMCVSNEDCLPAAPRLAEAALYTPIMTPPIGASMMKRLLTPIGARSWLTLGIILIVPPGATAALAAATFD